MINNNIKIENKLIGENNPCFIIAEAGVNHNGSLETAKKLIDVAADAKVDAVKFQTFKAEKLVTKDANQAEYQTKNIGKEESQFDMLKRLELKDEFHKILKDYSEKKGLIFMSTPFDEDSIDFLDELGVKIFKAGSSELNNLPYLKKMASKGKPMIISTGMSTLDEIKESVSTIKKINSNLVVLHCTTNYPTHYSEVNLRAIKTMKKELNCLIGYSDHTEGIIVPIVAVAMGATVIEKHLTLDKNMKGPDHKASLEPNELKEMVNKIRLVEKILGSKNKEPTKSELKISKVIRKSIITRQDISKNEKITTEMLIIKRPGTGLKPKHLSKVIGRKAIRNIKKDELISFNDLK
jgi:N,N'-diacetyllegionaminate synthase